MGGLDPVLFDLQHRLMIFWQYSFCYWANPAGEGDGYYILYESIVKCDKISLLVPNDFIFLSRYCIWWHFVRISSENFSRSTRIVLRYYYLTISTGSPWIIMETDSTIWLCLGGKGRDHLLGHINVGLRAWCFSPHNPAELSRDAVMGQRGWLWRQQTLQCGRSAVIRGLD